MGRQNTGLMEKNKVTSGTSSLSNKDGKLQKRKKNSTRETVEAVLIALIAAMFLRAFVVQAFRIPTGSMKDTLLVGDFLLVNKFIYGVRTTDRIPFFDINIPYLRLPSFKAPRNGDVVVVKYPRNEKLDYIKRCIAVGGQTVEMRNGDVFVDGKPEGEKLDLGQQYAPYENPYPGGGRYVRYTRITNPYGKSYVTRHYGDHDLNSQNENFGPITVPQGHYFMMGDNRDNSADGRAWGMLPEENVVGEALIIYFSWNKNGGPFWNLIDRIRWSRIANIIR